MIKIRSWTLFNIVIQDAFGSEIETGADHVFVFGETHGFLPTHL